MNNIQTQLEQERKKLNEMVNKSNNLTTHEILKQSQLIDQLINQANKILNKQFIKLK
jgi:hypothetical protein